MDSFDIAFMADELITIMESRGLSIDDMKIVAKVVKVRVENMETECDKL